MKNATTAILLLLTTLFINSAMAIDAKALSQARQQLLLAVAGNEDATEKAYFLFEQLLKKNPNNPMLLANLGSLETLKGRDAWMPWNKMSYVEDGLEKIDHAIEMTEDSDYKDSQINGLWQSIAVKNIAANTFISLPSMFNRYNDGKEELFIMLSDSKFKQAPALLKKGAYQLAIQVAKQDGDKALVKKYQSMIETIEK